MPKLKSSVPKYGHHKPSGKAVVRIGGKTIYLGTYGTQKSRDRYDAVVAEWLAKSAESPLRFNGNDCCRVDPCPYEMGKVLLSQERETNVPSLPFESNVPSSPPILWALAGVGFWSQETGGPSGSLGQGAQREETGRRQIALPLPKRDQQAG